MRMVKKIFIALFVSWLVVLVLMPKQELYYKLEEELAKNDIKINEQNIEEGLFSLTIKEATVYVKGIKLASIEKIHFFTLLFYNKIELQSLLLDDSLKTMAPVRTDTALLSQMIVSPANIKVDAKGLFGAIVGNIDLSKRNLHLDFNESKEIEMIKSKLKQDEKGWYYETSF